MIRRQARERREYIYRKSQEAQERQTYERKQKLKDALASGKQLPTELRKDATELGKVMSMDESQAEPTSHIDDEYSRAGIMDPKIVITTSRDPSSKLLQFAKEMRLVFPNSTRINRGNYVVKELADACRANDVTDLVVLHEHRGVPDALIVSHFPHGPTLYFSLHNVGLRHDIATYNQSTVSEQYPHLIFEGFSSKLGKRVMDALRYLFPVPKPDATRVMTFANENDFISFRHHVFAKTSHKEVQLAEVGPRFEMKHPDHMRKENCPSRKRTWQMSENFQAGAEGKDVCASQVLVRGRAIGGKAGGGHRGYEEADVPSIAPLVGYVPSFHGELAISLKSGRFPRVALATSAWRRNTNGIGQIVGETHIIITASRTRRPLILDPRMDIGAPIFRGIGFVRNNGACFDSNWRKHSLNVSMQAALGTYSLCPIHSPLFLGPRDRIFAPFGGTCRLRASLIGDSVFTQPPVAPSRRFGRPDPDTPAFSCFQLPPFLSSSGLFPYSISLFSPSHPPYVRIAPFHSSNSHFSICLLQIISADPLIVNICLVAAHGPSLGMSPRHLNYIRIDNPPFHIRALIHLPNLVLTLPRPNRTIKLSSIKLPPRSPLLFLHILAPPPTLRQMSAPSTYPQSAPVSTGPPPNMVTSPRSKRPRPPDLHTGTNSGLPATTGAPVSGGPTTGGFPTPSSATGAGDDVFHQEDGEDGEDDDDDEAGPRKGTEKKAGRRKIKIEFIQDKSRRHITFSKRKAGIMKKAYELSTLTGTQVLLLVVSETGLVYTFTTAKLQPLVTQPEGKNLIQACLNAPNGTLPGGASAAAPGMPPPPPTGRQRPTAMSLGMTGAASPNNDAEGEDDGEGSGDSPNMGSAKGRRRRRTNSSSGAVPGGNMAKSIPSPSDSMPSTSPTLSMQQAHGGVSGAGAAYGSHPTHSPTLPHHHHGQHHLDQPGMYGYPREGGASANMMPGYHHGQYSGLNAGGMPSGMSAGSVPGAPIGQAGSQPQQSQMWMQQGNMPRR
ncbi:Brix protein, partial [Rhizoctonia solani]